MSYNPAYTTRFSGLDGTLWEIVIGINGFDGAPMEISLEGDEPCVIEWQETGKTDVVQSSTCILRVSNESDRQMVTLMHGHIDAACIVMRDGKEYWFGHIDDSVYEEPYSFTKGYVTELTFSDFGILNRIPFELHGKQSVGAIVRDCLESVGYVGGHYQLLASLLEPKTFTPLTLDMLYIDADRFAPDGQSWSATTTKREALEEILRPLGLRVMQKSGRIFVYDIECLRDDASLHRRVVWKGTDAWLRGSETYGRYEVAFETDADATLASDELDRDSDEWSGSKRHFANSYDETTDTESDIGFYIEARSFIDGATVQKSANARFFRTTAVFTDSNDTGIAWRVKCKEVLYNIVDPGTGQSTPVAADRILVGNTPSPNLAQVAEVFHVDTGHLPIVPTPSDYQLRVSLDFLLSFRSNPLDSPPDEWAEQQTWYTSPWLSMEKEWRERNFFGQAVPAKLEVIDEQGNPVCHYVNAYTEDRYKESFGHQVSVAVVYPLGIGKGLWVDGPADSFGRMILAYYRDYDPDDTDRDALVNRGWVGNRISLSEKKQINGTLYRRRTDGEYLPLPPVAGKLRLTIGSGVFPIDEGDYVLQRFPYACFTNIAWQLYRNPKITLVMADRKDDDIATDDVYNRKKTPSTAPDTLAETLKAGTWQKRIAPSARGLLFRADGTVWECLVKEGIEDTLQAHRLRCLVNQTCNTQPVLSGTAELDPFFSAKTEASTKGVFLVTALRQDLQQAIEHVTIDCIGGYYNYDIPTGNPFHAAWSDPLCALSQASFAFLWTNPLCTLKPGPFQAAWSDPLCILRYQYDLNWETMLEEH